MGIAAGQHVEDGAAVAVEFHGPDAGDPGDPTQVGGQSSHRPTLRVAAVVSSVPQPRHTEGSRGWRGALGDDPDPPATPERRGAERAPSPRIDAAGSRNRDGRRVARAPGVRAPDQLNCRSRRARVSPT